MRRSESELPREARERQHFLGKTVNLITGPHSSGCRAICVAVCLPGTESCQPSRPPLRVCDITKLDRKKTPLSASRPEGGSGCEIPCIP